MKVGIPFMNKKLIIYLVSFAAFFGPFTQTIYTPMLPEIQHQFQTSEFTVNLTISIFTIVLALMQIVYGPLIDTYGRRKVLLQGIALYIVASVGAALSPSIYVLIIFRALQAGGMAVGSVVATTVIGDLFEGKLRGRAMGTFQMLVALGPVVGPVIGGFVGGEFGFHGVFWVLAITATILLGLNAKFLPETKPEMGNKDRFKLRDFSSILVKPAGAAIIVLGFIQYFTFYTFLVFLPSVLSNFQLSTSQSGMVFLPMSLFVVIGSVIGGRIQERFESRKLLIVTASFNVASTFLFVILSSLSLSMLMVGISLFGLFLGLSLPVQTTLLVNEFQHNRATATGIYNFFRYLGMAAGPMIGTVFFHLGDNMEFIVAGVLFACAVVFAIRQFFHRQQESVV
jgi:MFS transporter, DHA1 family, multidrug resistance protein